MDKGKNYEVKNFSLAKQGKKNIEWAEMQMGALMQVRARFAKEKPLDGIKIGMALHVTKETAVLAKTFIAGGAEVALCSCNPLSTQDDVAAALASEGFSVFAWKGETKEEYYRCLKNVLAFNPTLTIDDGCDLVSIIHKDHPDMIKQLICGCEETTTGVIRLKNMEREKALLYPIIAINESNTKHLMDNIYGTAQSTIDGIIRASNILIAGKILVILGYGNCGKGVAMRGSGLGANVVVTEVDPFKALQAKMMGFRVMKMEDAAKIGDIFITLTGNKHVITPEHINEMKNGAILANSGHFDIEIDLAGIEKITKNKETVRPLFDRYTLNNGKSVFVCGEGRLVNLACAEGHPSEVMSLSFCNQALAVEWGVKNKGKLKPAVYVLPNEIDMEIASLQLKAVGIEIDKLTDDQKKYLSSWQEGT